MVRVRKPRNLPLPLMLPWFSCELPRSPGFNCCWFQLFNLRVSLPLAKATSADGKEGAQRSWDWLEPELLQWYDLVVNSNSVMTRCCKEHQKTGQLRVIWVTRLSWMSQILRLVRVTPKLPGKVTSTQLRPLICHSLYSGSWWRPFKTLIVQALVDSRLSKSIAEERNKLRLFVVKAKVVICERDPQGCPVTSTGSVSKRMQRWKPMSFVDQSLFFSFVFFLLTEASLGKDELADCICLCDYVPGQIRLWRTQGKGGDMNGGPRNRM